MKSAATSARKISMRLTVPEPSSSAPGARPEEGELRLIESSCAPRTTVGAVVEDPVILAMMDC